MNKVKVQKSFLRPVWFALAVLSLQATAAVAVTAGADGKIAPHLSFTLDFEAADPTPITATVTPADATGTVTFKIGGNQIGAPVALMGGRAVSEPVLIPKMQSYAIFVEYSGDETYSGVASTLHSDWAPEEEATPEPTVSTPTPSPAAPPVTPATPATPAKVRTLPRTGDSTGGWLAAAMALLVAGTVPAALHRKRPPA
ncbi:MAG TPA: Ig-like domain-containing protein [Actinomycetota bacterium]|nr:Ig-like domain-containing protein [Actinomycetota bacterium]